MLLVSANKKGFSLVEALLALSLFGMILVATVGVYFSGPEASVSSANSARAINLAQEGLEAAKAIRDVNFSNLVVGNWGLNVGGTSWSFIPASDTIDIFHRQISIADIDAYSKSVTSTVAWQQNGQRTNVVVLNEVLTNWRSRSGGNWASSSIESFIDLSNANSGNAGANGNAVYYQDNFAYLGRANSGGREFYIFNVADSLNPVLNGQIDLNGNPNDIVVNGNYAYVASSDDNSELQVINIADKTAPTLVNVVNLTTANSGNNTADAKALAVNGSHLVMMRLNSADMVIFDLANPALPVVVGRAPCLGNIYDVVTIGNYAYGVSDDDNNELQIFNITNKLAPNRVATYNLNSGNNTANAISVSVGTNNKLFIGRQNSSAPHLYLFDISNSISPILEGVLSLGTGDFTKILYNDTLDYIFAVTSQSTNNFNVIDVTNKTAPLLLGQLTIAPAPLDLDFNLDIERIFIASSANNPEFLIIKPQ